MGTTVTSNGVEIPFDGRYFEPMRDSTDLLNDPVALRARYASDGYLYLRQVLRPEEALEVRGAYFSQFEASYLRPGTTPAHGTFSGLRPPGLAAHGVEGHPAHAFVRGRRFGRLVAQPALAALAETVLGGRVRRLPRSIIRHFDRSTPVASRAHVDHSYLDAGTDRLLTVWIPLGDCPPRTGGVVYLEDTHRMDPAAFEPLRAVSDRPGDRRPISHDLGFVARRLGRRWRWADYRAGDVTVHSPHLVHASLDTTTDVMRLSADVRFVREGDACDPRWMEVWSGDDGY